MEVVAGHQAVCDSCARPAFVLHAVDGATLCDGCAEKSVRIDQQLARTRVNDPVFCDGCEARVDFDAKAAVVVRECGGGVLCDRCKPVEMERTAS